MNFTSFTRKNGLRRTVKVYGPERDSIMEARRRRFEELNGAKPRKPHANLETSVREKLR